MVSSTECDASLNCVKNGACPLCMEQRTVVRESIPHGTAPHTIERVNHFRAKPKRCQSPDCDWKSGQIVQRACGQQEDGTMGSQKEPGCWSSMRQPVNNGGCPLVSERSDNKERAECLAILHPRMAHRTHSGKDDQLVSTPSRPG
jgi:hypothetical protein